MNRQIRPGRGGAAAEKHYVTFSIHFLGHGGSTISIGNHGARRLSRLLWRREHEWEKCVGPDCAKISVLRCIPDCRDGMLVIASLPGAGFHIGPGFTAITEARRQ